MKKIVTIATLTFLISCNKQSVTPQPTSNNNITTTSQTPCSQYGACLDGTYKFEPNASLYGVQNDTVLNSNAQIRYTFVGYAHENNQAYNDSLKYKLVYVNIDLKLFTYYTNYIYRSYNYKWPVIQLTTKSSKNVLFKRL